MKAILVNSLSSGGGEKIALEVYQNLISSEDVVLILLEDKIEYIDKNKYDSNNIVILKNKFGKLLDLFYFAYQLNKIVKNNKLTYIQSHLYRSNFVNVICKKIFFNKYFCQIINHGDPYRYKLSSLNGLINRILIKYLYVRSDSLIAISQLMKINLNKILANKAKVDVVNNPYNIKEIIEKSTCSSSIELPEKYYVSMGRLIQLKNFDLILKSVAELKYNLVIIGEGEELPNLQSLAKKLKIEKNIFFVGRLNNPYCIIKNAIAYIGASESEGFPNAIIESLTLSIPVIHSDCISGPREILSPSSNPNDILSDGFEPAKFGLLYDVGNVEALNNCIRYLTDNLDYQNSIIKLGYLRAFDFDSSNIVEKYFNNK